jgi:phosphatidylserine/phosphatidylglycerophosphate/cardiolipin synthase-like enzyme
MMHNKFCIIDLKIVIHGSYNWTNRAKFNNETIEVVSSHEVAEKFSDQFIQLKRTALG